MSDETKATDSQSEGSNTAADVAQLKDTLSRIEHPLRSSWRFYYFKPDHTTQNWSAMMRPICDFDSVEGYWSLFINIVKPSQMLQKHDFYLFKSEIKPEWEDPKNKNGGRWTMMVKDPRTADKRWEALCMAVCGAQFDGDDNDYICGITASLKKPPQYKLNIWTSDEQNRDVQMRIGMRIKDVCEMTDNQNHDRLKYEAHETTKPGGNAGKRFIYEV